MQTKIIAIGHKNPDTDSVLSAILVSMFGKKIFGEDVEAAIAGDVNNETEHILNSLKLEKPKLVKNITDENVIVVDTTEMQQIVDGLSENNLFAIIDHHNLGGLKSSKPIYVRVEPMGCACSIIYKILSEKKIKIDKKAAMLIISGIISDTLNLASPTTSDEDRKILKNLSRKIKLNTKEYASKLFGAKSSLKGISKEEIVGKDYKNFEMGKSKVGIGVWETTNPESVNEKKNEIMEILKDRKEKDGLDYIYFAVVDILKNNSQLYLAGDEEKKLAENAFKLPVNENKMFLAGVVSRKKQIVPPLMKALGK